MLVQVKVTVKVYVKVKVKVKMQVQWSGGEAVLCGGQTAG